MTLADKIVVLKDGEVMQVGSPMELFNQPANEFVAGFLGSPKMNFFDGVLSDVADDGAKAGFKGEGIDAANLRLVSSEKSSGDAARIGIRPQHLVLDPKGPIAGTIGLVERLGTETVVELRSASDTPFRFATPENLDLKVGDDVRFGFDEMKAHLF